MGQKKHSNKKRWSDHYSEQAKKDNYPARSVYKLEEIQKKYTLIKKGNTVLDLGCSPGSWLMYAAKLVGDKGLVVGIDRKPVSVNVPSNTLILTGDILSLEKKLSVSINRKYNVVLSDMAPDTTGNKFVDNARSYDLCQAAFSIAKDMLVPGGSFVCKIFQGEEFKNYSDLIKANFNIQKIFKPQSSRKVSREIFIIGKGKK